METLPPDLRLWMSCKIHHRLGWVSACDTHVHVFTILRTYDSHACWLLVLYNILLSRLLDRRRNWFSESNNRRYWCGRHGLVYPRIEYWLKETREGNSRDFLVLILSRESIRRCNAVHIRSNLTRCMLRGSRVCFRYVSFQVAFFSFSLSFVYARKKDICSDLRTMKAYLPSFNSEDLGRPLPEIWIPKQSSPPKIY